MSESIFNKPKTRLAAVAAGVAFAILGGRWLVEGGEPSAPQKIDAIASYVPNGTFGANTYDVTIRESDGQQGTITRTLEVAADMQGLPKGEARTDGITADAQQIENALLAAGKQLGPAGQVSSPTPLELKLPGPVIDQDASNEDPTVTFTPTPSVH